MKGGLLKWDVATPSQIPKSVFFPFIFVILDTEWIFPQIWLLSSFCTPFSTHLLFGAGANDTQTFSLIEIQHIWWLRFSPSSLYWGLNFDERGEVDYIWGAKTRPPSPGRRIVDEMLCWVLVNNENRERKEELWTGVGVHIRVSLEVKFPRVLKCQESRTWEKDEKKYPWCQLFAGFR